MGPALFMYGGFGPQAAGFGPQASELRASGRGLQASAGAALADGGRAVLHLDVADRRNRTAHVRVGVAAVEAEHLELLAHDAHLIDLLRDGDGDRLGPGRDDGLHATRARTAADPIDDIRAGPELGSHDPAV